MVAVMPPTSTSGASSVAHVTPEGFIRDVDPSADGEPVFARAGELVDLWLDGAERNIQQHLSVRDRKRNRELHALFRAVLCKVGALVTLAGMRIKRRTFFVDDVADLDEVRLFAKPDAPGKPPAPRSGRINADRRYER